MAKTLFVFGYGYSAHAIGKIAIEAGWRVCGTTRDQDKLNSLRKEGIDAFLFSSPESFTALKTATHILHSVAPTENGDPVIENYAVTLKTLSPEWAGYLSTTAVYGNRDGAWVDESSELLPSTKRGVARVKAEAGFLELFPTAQIFRLAGIYGPNRGPFAKILNGRARRIIKENQVFSRIHVEDIAGALWLSMLSHPSGPNYFNLCDDSPAPPEDVIEFAAELLGAPTPPSIAFEKAHLSEMAKSFYAESKRVSNAKIKSELGYDLKFPDYKAGLMHDLKGMRKAI